MSSLAELEYLVAYVDECAEDLSWIPPEKLLRIASALREAARDRRRLGALERAVLESAKRGAWLELDARYGGIVVFRYWSADTDLAEAAADGTTLGEALDALADAQEVADRG